jgi:hypothetical protein
MSLLFRCTQNFDKFQKNFCVWITLLFETIYSQVYPEADESSFYLAFHADKKKPGFIRAWGAVKNLPELLGVGHFELGVCNLCGDLRNVR